MSWVAGASEEGPVGPRRSESYIPVIQTSDTRLKRFYLFQSRLSNELDNVRFRKKVYALDDNKTSALHYAARHDNQRAVELLLSWGADVNLKGEEK